MKKRIVIDLIMANTCNKKCEYCCIKFNGKKLEKPEIDSLLEYLETYRDDYLDCVLNFFGGEPLLNYENIVYLVKKNRNPKISYILGTNGFLLTEDKLQFFAENKVKIYLSFHADSTNSYERLLEKKYLLKHDDIDINFIVSPLNIRECYTKFEKLVTFGFKNVNIIPVMLTMKWDISAIKELSAFIDYVDQKHGSDPKYQDLRISKYSFFDGIIQEKTFVVDYNLNVYQDSSDELYIGKQFIPLGKILSDEIEKGTFLGNIRDNGFRPSELITKHSIKNVFSLVYKLPKKMGYVQDYHLIHKIMNRNIQEHQRGSYGIFGSNNSSQG